MSQSPKKSIRQAIAQIKADTGPYAKYCLGTGVHDPKPLTQLAEGQEVQKKKRGAGKKRKKGRQPRADRR